MRLYSSATGILTLMLGEALSSSWNYVDEVGFQKALQTNEYTLVAYLTGTLDYGEFKSEWTTLFRGFDKEGNVISVNCSIMPDVCRESDVVSFPTVRLHHQGGKFDRYRGPRRAKDMSAFLSRMLRPTVTLLDENAMRSFLSVDDIVLVVHIAAHDRNLEERFTKTAEQYRDRYSFAIGPPPNHESSLGCINNVNDEKQSITDLESVGAIESLVKLCSQPLVPELTRRNEAEYSRMGKSIVHYFVSRNEDREKYVNAIRPLAKRYQEYLVFSTTDANEYPEMVPLLGHKTGSNSVLSVQNPTNGDIFPYTGGKVLTAAVVEAFLTDIITGKVKPWDRQSPHNAEAIKHEEL